MAEDVYDFSVVGSSTPGPVDPIHEPETGSPLERLREKITKKIERPEVFVDVPERPGVLVKISPNITQEQMKAWRKNSGENTKNGFDSIKFACYVIGSTARGIVIDDEEVFNENGHPVSFASPEILEMTGTTRPVPDCVRAFFGLDPHVEAAAVAIMDASGWGDEVDMVDPTKTSSTDS